VIRTTTSPLRQPGAVLLVSCYELGHQPLGVAWPKAFLERAGFTPAVVDLSLDPLSEAQVRDARVAVIAVPMHTALRLGVRAAERIRRINPDCPIVFTGLYALLNADYLRAHGATAVLGGEFEAELVALLEAFELPRPASPVPRPTLERLDFPVPSRSGLPPLTRYVKLEHRGRLVPVGYVEASRGCLHECLHCPIPPVYGGRFFAVPHEVVLEDIRRLIAAGAGHITFGDPDFLNGPGHARRLVRALHAEFPDVTYDFTAKIEHLLEHQAMLPEFAATGCLFIVSAVESLSDVVLGHLEKGHSRADVVRALGAVREAGLALRPTFIPFTPWSTREDYLDTLDFVEGEGLIGHVDPVQYSIRLLVPPGSLLLSRPALRSFLGRVDPAAFTYRWMHPDPGMDALHRSVSAAVADGARFVDVRVLAGQPARAWEPPPERPIPARLTEPWFC